MGKDRVSVPTAALERPLPGHFETIWGSDVLASAMRATGVEFVALNPGASYRGLHDSIVNHLGNERPQMLLCLHEEHAVSIAHGYAKVTNRPMAVVLHSNVGLMHGLMSIYNAWCDRVPMLLFGATGPVDANSRRPWIDWIHTSRDQGALLRNFTKWDDQPASVEAAVDAVLRANLIAQTAPRGPTYVNFDVSLQERQLNALPPPPDASRHQPPAQAAMSTDDSRRCLEMLRAARNPVILCGRVSRLPEDWSRRVALAEAFGAVVITDLKVGASFPTRHELHPAGPGILMTRKAEQIVAGADLIVSLDWVDLAGTLKAARNETAQVIQFSQDHVLHNGWGMEHQGLPAVDLSVACSPDTAVGTLISELGVIPEAMPRPRAVEPIPFDGDDDAPLDINVLPVALSRGLEGQTPCFVRLPLGWVGEAWDFDHPLDYLGYDGGAGIGSGPGMLIGAALALQGSERLPVAVLGDGDFMMASSAIWTGVHYNIPFLAIISNNRSFFNDEVHQERVAISRDRPVENKWIGQRIDDPAIDIAAIARAQGAEGIGPVKTVGELAAAVQHGAALAKAGKCVVIDARVDPGYGAGMTAGLMRRD